MKQGAFAISFVDLARQYQTIKQDIDQAIRTVVRDGNFILGKEVTRLEGDLARLVGTKYAVGCASGTDAIFLILKALGIGPADEVITQANTFIATVLPAIHLGARVKLVDIDLSTGQIDVAAVRKAITGRTKAIIPVHLFGSPAPMREVKAMLADQKVSRALPFIIEDNAQAIGASINGKKTGSFGKAAAISFYPGKNLGAYGDAGAVVTDDKKLADTIRILANVGQSRKYLHVLPGFNSRLDTIQAAILRVKLKHLSAWNKRRDFLARRYIRNLRGLGDLHMPPLPPKGIVTNWHLFVIQTDKRDKLRKFLEKKGIHTLIHYPIPLHLQPCLRSLGYKRGDFPSAERWARRILSLPMFPELTLGEQDRVIAAIKTFFS